MLWLALYLPDLPLEVFAHGRSPAQPLVVSEVEGGRIRVARCNREASSRGIKLGMALPAALALDGGVEVRERRRKAEVRELRAVAAWAYQFSPRIAFDPLTVLLEIGGSLRLFGSRDALVGAIERGLRELGHRALLASAPNPLGALLLARHCAGDHAGDLAALQARVMSLPLPCLVRERRTQELIAGIGLATIGDCLALPRGELARRVGPGLGHTLDRLLGRVPDPRPLWQPPRRFRGRMVLPAEISDSMALVFPARRLLLALEGFLRGLGGGTQMLRWQLHHREGPNISPCSVIDQGLAAPSRDSTRLLELFRERLERVRLAAPVVEMGLQVDRWLPLAEGSQELFRTPLANTDSDLLERLRARLGEACVRGLQARPDHRPEWAWRFCTPGEAGNPEPRSGPRPLWLLPQPQPLRTPNGAPHYGGPLCLGAVPERIESGWWDGRDVTRDYYLALSRAGERLWIYRDRRSGRWYLHGRFD